MSVCRRQIENVPQNFSKKNSKNISKCKLTLNSKKSETSGVQLRETEARNQCEERVRREIQGWRRAVIEDKNAILQLQTLSSDVTNLLYRNKSLDDLIENSYFTVVQFDTEGDLISFTAYDSYPNLPFHSFWIDWIKSNYEIDEISPRNVFFVHYMVWLPEHENAFLPLLLKTSFTEFWHLKHIIVVQPPHTEVPQFYNDYFIPICPVGVEEFETSSIQLLRLCLRSSVIHPLYIRSAFEHEFDIIFPAVKGILKNTVEVNNADILQLFEFLFHKDKKTLICEYDGQLAGVMTLNLKIDLDTLNDGFELGPFNNFRKKNLDAEDSEPNIPELDNRQADSESILMTENMLLPLGNWLSHPNGNSSSKVGSFISSTDNFSFYDYYPFEFNKNNIGSSEPAPSHGKTELTTIRDINVLLWPSESAVTHFFPSKYSGQSNAFLIEFFAIDSDEINEKLSFFDFLEAAFKIIPDREYCFMLSPTSCLQCNILDFFVRATPKLLSSFNQELYLCHRNSFSVKSLLVRNTELNDFEEINSLLKNVNDGDIVYRDITECFENENNERSFVLTFEKAIIGVSLINDQDYSEHLRMHFEVPDHKFGEQCRSRSSSVIKHLVLNPVFNTHALFFIRDIMSIVDVTCLYYVHTTCKTHKTLLTALAEFIPVKPRRKADTKYLSTSFVKEHRHSYKNISLRVLFPRLCGFHRIHLNTILVVVGASDTAKSFLESLIFGPENYYCTFNNIICVSPRGLDVEDEEDSIETYMFEDRNNHSRSYTTMLSLSSHVNCLHGYMTKINRSEKFIVVNDKNTVKYDYLVLTCGLQYFPPVPAAHVKVKSNSCKSTLSRFLNKNVEKHDSKPPKSFQNMFIINTYRDAQFAIRYISFLMDKLQLEGRKIVVYGHNLQVFMTINTLLKLGIPGEHIAFVEPFPTKSEKVAVFNDPHVDNTVIELVKQCNVNYHEEYILYDWVVNSEDYITLIKFHSESRSRQLVIPCLAFFSFQEKLVSDITFRACRDAGLVYDGRLVINHNFRTNDCYIYAAGSFTKYARRYFANECNHQYYNSREVGQKLAAILNGKLNPMVEDKTIETSELVPRLQEPVFYHCQLPGELNLFSLRKPGKQLDLETLYNISDYGEVLTTGISDKDAHEYFRLHLDRHGFVESITCFSKSKIDFLNLRCLYGLHEKLLNNLLLKFDMCMIPNLLHYFRQPWASALYHDKFKEMSQKNYETLFHEITSSMRKLEEVNWNQIISQSSSEELELIFMNSEVCSDIKNNVITFLEEYQEDLPHYATSKRIPKCETKNKCNS